MLVVDAKLLKRVCKREQLVSVIGDISVPVWPRILSQNMDGLLNACSQRPLTIHFTQTDFPPAPSMIFTLSKPCALDLLGD